MRNLVKLSQDELLKRAKTLYFDKYPALETLYVDCYGRFDVNTKVNLEEQGRVYNAEVFEIKRANLPKTDKKAEK
jgi:hypothetical protein